MLPEFGEEKSISIKEAYEKILYYLRSVLKQWFFIVILGAAGATAVGLYAYFSKSYYEADLTFVVKTKDSKGVGLDNILGQLGWGASGGNANLPKVKSVAFSKSVLKEALYDSVVIDGKHDLLANHFAEAYGLKDKWKDKDLLNNFDKFEIEQKNNDSSIVQNVAFKSILNLLRGNKKNDGILAIEMNELTDMLSFKVRSLNEGLSYNLSNHIFLSLNQFYLNDEVSTTKSTLDDLKREIDSVGNLLKTKELELAGAQDRNYGIILRSNQVNQEEMRRDITVLTGVYAQMRQNYELRSFSLKTNSSIFDVLEHPVLPLVKKRKSVFVYSMIGMIMGIAASIVILVIRRFLLDELK